MLDDIRHALRSLAHRPGFTAVTVLTVAVAMAATAAIFSVLKPVALSPLPWPDPSRLVTVDVKSSRGFYISTSVPNYRDWGARARSFETWSAVTGWSMTLTGRGRPEVLPARAVLGDFFRTLRVTPALGRVFSGPEAEPGAEPVAVLGYAFWKTRLAADSGIVGQSLILDRKPYVVIGVLPESFGYPTTSIAIYFPLGTVADLPWTARGSSFGSRILARLKPGVPVDVARDDLARAGREVQEAEGRPVGQPELRPLDDYLLGSARGPAWILMAGVTFVLLIAVANVANLMLARGEDRRRELAVRAALGAAPGAVLRAVLAESLVVSLAGGVAGLALSVAAVRAILPLIPADAPQMIRDNVRVDWVVAGFTLLLAAGTGIAFGLVPAWRASRTDPNRDLREGTRGSSAGGHRLRSGLVVAEVALALVLLIGAGLMVRTMDQLDRTDKGFVAEGVLTGRVAMEQARYPDKERWRAFYAELLPRLASIRGVEGAAAALLIPLADRSWEQGILPDGVPVEDERRESVLYNMVTPSYFEVMRVPIVRGRAFTDQDREGSLPVAMIDETMAAKFWPGEDPIGKRVTFERMSNDSHAPTSPPFYRTVVGVTRNLRHYEVAVPSRIQVYVPVAQSHLTWGQSLNLILRTDVPPASITGDLERTVAATDPELPLTGVRPLADYVENDMAGRNVVRVLLSVFSAMALALAAVGIFGVMSYSVLQRTREIGIRMALGADRTRVLRWVAIGGLRLSAAGIVIGLGAAAGLTRLMRTLLYQVRPLEPGLYAALAAVLLVVAVAAACIPARRATRVNPVVVLNQEG